MKINEITNPYLRGIVKGLTGVEFTPTSNVRQLPSALKTKATTSEPTQTSKPEPTSATQPTPGPSSQQQLPAGVSVLSLNPIVLQVGKRRFELDDIDQWHPLGSKKTVSPGEAAILNKYLLML